MQCSSKKCPKLSCPSELQIRPDQLSCCKVCKDPPPTTTAKPTTTDPNSLQDMPDVRMRTEDDVLQEGGCKWKGEVNITDTHYLQAFYIFEKTQHPIKSKDFRPAVKMEKLLYISVTPSRFARTELSGTLACSPTVRSTASSATAKTG